MLALFATKKTQIDTFDNDCTRYYDEFNKMIRDKIDKTEFLSLDVFETSVLRPAVDCGSLFNFQGRFKNSDNNLNFEFEKCQKEIQNKYNVSEEKAKRMALEQDILKLNPEIFAIYNYALRRNKKIIFVSDTDYDKNFLEGIVKKLGYKKFDKFYASSNFDNKTKHSGELFKIVLNDLKVNPDKILHVGDNFDSDVKNAERSGINAIHYKSPINNFLKTENGEKFKKLLKLSKNDAPSNVATALVALNLEKIKNKSLNDETFWKNDGYILAPIACAFASFVKNEIIKNSYDHVIFGARDGLIVKRILEKSYKLDESKNFYLQINRKICDECRENSKKYDIFKKYITKRVDLNKKILFVDSCLARFSAQRLLIRLFGNEKVKANYFFVDFSGNASAGIDPKSYNVFLKKIGAEKTVRLMMRMTESILFTSSEPRCDGISEKLEPIFCKYDKIIGEEKHRMSVIDYIHQGIMEFVDEMGQFKFLSCDLFRNENFIRNLLLVYQDNPTEIENKFREKLRVVETVKKYGKVTEFFGGEEDKEWVQ